MKIPSRLRATIFCGLLSFFGNAHAWQSDNGDGSYTNPILHADYSDPDIIRVGADFYMASSSFVASPGLTVLKSKDMVNWEFAGHAADPVGTSDGHNLANGQTAYEGGFWAPSIRHRNGVFYIAVQPTFANGRIYYATNPAGPWNFHQLDRTIYDPGFFIDTDGTGYLLSGHGPQSLMVLNSTYSAVVAQYDNHVNSGGEGTHLVKRGSWYYAFNANPGVWPFQLRCSRTQDLVNGPWETGHICLTATTGGHQGAIVDVNDSDQWYGFVHQDSGAIGRMPRIGPVFWENNWPVFGTPSARDVMGATYPKPVAGQPVKVPATSDDFGSSSLGLQWQWNHNPDASKWSLTERPGHLRLRPGQASEFWKARNTLTQKFQGPRSQGVVKLDLSAMQPGDIAGFGTLGKVSAHLAVTAGAGGSRTLSMKMRNDKVGEYTAATGVAFSGNTLYLRTDLDFTRSLGVCAYSTDGTSWTTLGGNFPLMFGYGSTWQGEQFALFSYNPDTASSSGHVDVDSFTFSTLGDSADLVKTQRGRAKLNAARTTFVADNGQLLRGPYESTEWTTAAPEYEVARIKELGCNTVHLYAEVFDPNYPKTGSTAPGYAMAEIDKFVQMTRDHGLYLVITIGNGANNGNHNAQWATAFWNLYAPRYKDETHVLYEIHNEPMAWGPSYLTGTTPAGALDMNVACYNAIRSHAPNTPVLLFTYAVLAGTGGRDAALTDIQAFNQQVFGNPSAVWTNEVLGFHGYGGAKATAEAVSGILAAGYPCMMTEFIGIDWGSGEGQDVELTSDLERLGVSWNCFLTIPPYGVSPDVTKNEHFKDLVDRAGLSWVPDFGNWPVTRGVYGNGGQPRRTPETWVSDKLQGTLRIEAENFDTGGQGVAFNDNGANSGGLYRTSESVDITATSDTGGGYKVGWTEAGEWMEHTIWVVEPGHYDLRVRSATPNTGSSLRILCNGKDVTGTVVLPSSGGSDSWATTTVPVFLEAGRQKLRVEVVTGGFDLNWIELSPAATGPLADGIYKFVNRSSGLAMDGSGSDVTQAAYTGATSQQWRIEHVGAGNYRVSSVADNDRWTNGGVPNDKIGLVWWWGTDAPWQRFLFRPASDGYQRIVTASLGRELEPSGGSGATGAFIVSTGYSGYDGSAKQEWAVQTLTAPPVVGGLTVTVGSSGQVNASWLAVSGAASYIVKRSTSASGPFNAIASGLTTNTYVDSGITAGTTYYYQVTAVNAGGQEGLPSAIVSVLPPWRWQDVGATGVVGETSCSNLVFTLKGSGNDIWDTADAFHYAYLQVTGDCTITARVTGVQNTDSWAKAGVMIRETLSAGSPHAFTAVTPGNGVAFQARTTTGGFTSNASTVGLATPYWVRLVRGGNTFTGYRSVDGVTWTQQGSPANITMGSAVYMGLALTSHNNSQLCTATFDNVTTTPDWAPVITSPPPAPRALTAAGQPARTALSWNAVAEASSYAVKRSTTSGGPYALVANVTSPSFADTDVTNGTTYHYVVHAVNAAGEGPASAQASAAPAAPPSDLRLKFDEGSGTTAADHLGSTWSGTLADGATWTSGRFGSALGLDGMNDHVTLPKGVVSTLTDFTLSAWVKLDAAGNWVRVFDFGSGTDNYMFLTTSHGTSGIPRFAIRTPSTFEQIIDGNAALPVGAWTHLAVTLSGSTGTLYVNGDAVGTNSSITLTPSSLGLTPANYLGKSLWPDPYLDGSLDEFRIHGRALTAAEVATEAQGLRVHLAFNESAGTTAADSTGNGWNGTLVNGPTRVAGRSGNAVNLDGANDHISLPAGVVAGLTDFTLSAWVKLDAANHWVRVFDFGSGTDNYLFLTTSHGTSGIPRFAIRTPSTGEQIIDGDAVFPVGVWAHVAVTLSGSTGTLYVNGTAVGTNAGITLKPSDLGNTPANYLGKSQWADPYFDGLIEDFRIHDRALSATAISALVAQPAQSVAPIGEAELRAPLLSISGGIASVTVPVSVAGRLYQLQSSETLAEGSWVDLGDAQAGNGGSVVFSITVDSSDPRRFYRILIPEN